VVESDESTNNFDPEFTGADLREFESLVGPSETNGAAPEPDATEEEEADAEVESEGPSEGGGEDEWLDESDPSESWVEQSMIGAVPGSIHQPLGPLGSDRDRTTSPNGSGSNTPKRTNGLASSSKAKTTTSTKPSSSVKKVKTSSSSGSRPSSSKDTTSAPKGSASSAKGTPTSNGTSSSKGTTNGSTSTRGAIDISKPKKDSSGGQAPGGTNSVLTNSVQEKFKGFTFSGGESVVAMGSGGLLAQRAEERQRANGGSTGTGSGAGKKSGKTRSEDSASGGETTDSEFEDYGKSAGRYASTRRKGLGFTELDEDAGF